VHVLFVGASALLAFAPNAPGGDRQFDLICTGSVIARPVIGLTTGLGFVGRHPRASYSTRLRVDLAGGRFCQDKCGNSEPIAIVSPVTLLFRSRAGWDGNILEVQRGDGSFKYRWDSQANGLEARSYILNEAEGICVKAPFTGIPKNAF
jgi:hypothetical protein